jgi:hypothetical protein
VVAEGGVPDHRRMNALVFETTFGSRRRRCRRESILPSVQVIAAVSFLSWFGVLWRDVAPVSRRRGVGADCSDSRTRGCLPLALFGFAEFFPSGGGRSGREAGRPGPPHGTWPTASACGRGHEGSA